MNRVVLLSVEMRPAKCSVVGAFAGFFDSRFRADGLLEGGLSFATGAFFDNGPE